MCVNVCVCVEGTGGVILFTLKGLIGGNIITCVFVRDAKAHIWSSLHHSNTFLWSLMEQ